MIDELLFSYRNLLSKAISNFAGFEFVELSHHYGIDECKKFGALILVKKKTPHFMEKVIALLPQQMHPEHSHFDRDEKYEVIYGNMVLTVQEEDVLLGRDDSYIVKLGMQHKFKTDGGVVFVESAASDKFLPSVYLDKSMGKLSDRKTDVTAYFKN
jgi:mannose-6-phosphate isomerase-like protein (cupin superfamily)